MKTEDESVQPRIETSELGHTFTEAQLKQQCTAVYGGVAWPGKRPGFAVVLAMGRQRHFDSYDIFLLDEFESADLRVLVRRCGALDCKYKPTVWIGDNHNSAADRFIWEMNSQAQTPNDPVHPRRCFYPTTTQILQMEHPYEYILPMLKPLLEKDSRQLYLKSSKVIEYLSQIEQDEMPFMEFGEYPAIEALAFAVLEMIEYAAMVDDARRKRRPRPRHPMMM